MIIPQHAEQCFFNRWDKKLYVLSLVVASVLLSIVAFVQSFS